MEQKQRALCYACYFSTEQDSVICDRHQERNFGYHVITDMIGAKKYSVMSSDDIKKAQSNTRTSMNEGLQG